MLEVEELRAGYGGGSVLNGVALRVAPGEIVGLLGRNGSGRSTLLRVLMGLLPARGRARWQGTELLGLRPWQVARAGVGFVPEQRDVFPGLTVQQNLLLGLPPGRRAEAADFERAYALFPPLRERARTPAGVLSGGEQQMLALARTLMARPALLLVDEPTEGLSPAMAQAVAQALCVLRTQGTAVLLVEQKLPLAASLCQRLLVMGQGRIVAQGTPAALQAGDSGWRQWLAL